MKRLSFRARVFLCLFLFAAVPSTLVLLGGAAAVRSALPAITGAGAWDNVANSGKHALSAVWGARLTAPQRAALDAHEQELEASLTQARRFSFLASRVTVVVASVALLASLLLLAFASRVAGHLSRQLSRPIDELIGWTGLIARGERLPDSGTRRGAPEFATLRTRMRSMAHELDQARDRALQAERLTAFRETARRVAHELKNPLTPIRLAVARLEREMGGGEEGGVARERVPELAEVVEVLTTETRRLEEMARNFAQFGSIPEGPASEVDLGELVRYTARATVPDRLPLEVHVEDGLPLMRGHHDALARALSNVLINAVEACTNGGGVSVRVGRSRQNGTEAVELRVRDTGNGIPAARLARIWEPYVTSKSNGTGLGLAIARQTVLSHNGTVEAASSERDGTEIRFTFPVVRGPA